MKAINGTLRVSSRNPRYFTDDSGKTVYLTGSHMHKVLQDGGPVGETKAAFDYDAYLNLLTTLHHNFIRLWHFEGAAGETVKTEFTPLQYHRTGPGLALDGGLKYDVDVAGYPVTDNFNQAYFDRLRDRIIAARDRGIYVAVMLFQGWSVFTYNNDPWAGHPFHPDNNMNGIDGRGYLCHTLPTESNTEGQRILAIQKAYVRKVIDAVNDLDNVLYEISNEDQDIAASWQYDMIRYIKAYEAGKPKQHLVGMTTSGVEKALKNAQLFASPADWISPKVETDADYKDHPPAGTGDKVILSDTDHLWGFGGDHIWVWKTFMRGLHPIYMDLMTEKELEGFDPVFWNCFPSILLARAAMGDTLAYADKINLAEMEPLGDLSSTGYCMAQTGLEYLVLQPERDAPFTVALAAGTYAGEWFNLSDRSVAAITDLVSTGNATFAAPFSGEAVLYLKSVAD